MCERLDRPHRLLADTAGAFAPNPYLEREPGASADRVTAQLASALRPASGVTCSRSR